MTRCSNAVFKPKYSNSNQLVPRSFNASMDNGTTNEKCTVPIQRLDATNGNRPTLNPAEGNTYFHMHANNTYNIKNTITQLKNALNDSVVDGFTNTFCKPVPNSKFFRLNKKLSNMDDTDAALIMELQMSTSK